MPRVTGKVKMASTGKWEVVQGKSSKKRANFDKKKEKQKQNGVVKLEEPSKLVMFSNRERV